MKKFWSMLSILLAVMLMMSCAFAEEVEPAPADDVAEPVAEEPAPAEAPAEEEPAPAAPSVGEGVITDHGAIDHMEYMVNGKVILDANGDPVDDPEPLCRFAPDGAEYVQVIARAFYEEVLANGMQYFEDETIQVYHDWVLVSDSATCTEPGEFTYRCRKCGHTKKVASEALGHLWSSEVDGPAEWGEITKLPKCYEEGEAIDYCVRCGVKSEKTRAIEKIDHKFVETVVKVPHCYDEEKDGVLPEEDLYSEEWPNGYLVWYVYGESVMKCSVCGEIEADSTRKLKVEDYAELIDDPTFDGHEWDEWVPELPTTCIKDGRYVRWCKHCGLEDYKTEDAWKHSTNAKRNNMKHLKRIQRHINDCFTRYDVFKCELCGEEFHGMFVNGVFTEGEDFEVESHMFPDEVLAAKKVGYIDLATYEAWLENETEYAIGNWITDSPKPYHDVPNTPTADTIMFKDLIDTAKTVEPTCTEDGECVIKCLYFDKDKRHDDGDTITLKIKALGHLWDPEGGNGWVMEHDKGENGNEYAHWVRTCLRCNKTEDFNGNYTPEKCPEGAHKFVVISTDAATCEKDGSEFSVCEVCGEEKTVVLPATGHKWNEGTVTEPSCTAAGFTTFSCTECGEVKTEAGAAATGHTWNEGEVVVEAKCGVEGKILYTCTKCGDVKVETVPALEHVIVVDEAVEPQVGVEGKTEGSHCELCGEVLVAQETIPALVANEYEVVLDDVTEAEGDPSNVDGIGKVEKKEGTAPEQKMWARVSHSWVDADGFTYGAVTVVAVDEDGTFVMPSYSGYEDMTLVNVNVVLVNDRAGRAGAYAPYAISKPASK